MNAQQQALRDFTKYKTPLAVRQWTRPDCGTTHDRDVNAARDLLALGLAAPSRSTASSAECEACGEESAGSGRRPRYGYYETSTSIRRARWFSRSVTKG